MTLNRFIKKEAIPYMTAGDTVSQAIKSMASCRSGVVLITGEKGILQGIVSERDIVMRITAEGRNPDETTLREIMTTDIVDIPHDAAIDDAIRLMRKHRIRHLPVLEEDGSVTGLISLRYLLHDKIDDLIDEVRSLEAYFNDAPGG